MSSSGSGPDDPWRGQSSEQGGPPAGQPPANQPPSAGGPQYPAAPEYPAAPPYGYGYAGGPAGPPQQVLPLPPTVHWASILMFVRVGLGVLSLILVMTQLDDIVADAVADASPGTVVDEDAVRAAQVVFGVVGLILNLLLLWLAVLVRRGKNWARIVAVVLAGLGILGGLGSFAQSYDSALTTLNTLSLLAAIPIFVLLLLPQSNAFFSSHKQQPRY